MGFAGEGVLLGGGQVAELLLQDGDERLDGAFFGGVIGGDFDRLEVGEDETVDRDADEGHDHDSEHDLEEGEGAGIFEFRFSIFD
jgi:hypothetical protein